MKKCKKLGFKKYFREICSVKRIIIGYKFSNYGKKIFIRI